MSRKWKRSECELLTTWYAVKGPKLLALQMGRGKNSIAQKAYKMRLKFAADKSGVLRQRAWLGRTYGVSVDHLSANFMDQLDRCKSEEARRLLLGIGERGSDVATTEEKRAQVRVSLHKRRQNLKANGMCVDCGKAPRRSYDATLCAACTSDRSRRSAGFRLCLACADGNCCACDGCNCSCSWMDRKITPQERKFAEGECSA